ncbi:MAG TPA: ATP-binding protein, partial [Polyangiaceae bacterium]|nr:ATP-binding protein [Polyangiaceae bacterium]
SHRFAEVLSLCDVATVLRSALRVAATELRHRARVVERLEAVPPVRGSAARLGQVLLNLLVNAAQAIPPGAVEQNQVTVATGTGEDGAVLITITDSGCGVPEELRNRIFDPFFTTKPPGQGTGLGLAICLKIVRELGGAIELESRLGAGTTFRVRLPVATEAPPPPSTAPQASGRSGGQGLVLVVDDERPFADAVQRLLRGYVVTQALDGDEALECCRRQRFDAIVCDLVMPRRNGWELFAALRTERPGQEERMIFVTAGAAMPTAKAFLASVPNAVLEKPFDPQALRAAVRELCGRPGSGGPPAA